MKQYAEEEGTEVVSMSEPDEDDKPTVVLDLAALRKQKQKEEEQLNEIVTDLKFNTSTDVKVPEATLTSNSFKVILFDFQSDFFEKIQLTLPQGFEYQIARSLPELNQQLKSKTFQIIVFNYDVNSKAVNQLTAQIKSKFPASKTLIMASSISPEKARVHAQTPSGADGYYKLPLNPADVKKEFLKIREKFKQVS